MTPKRRPKRKTVRVRVPRVGTVRQARVSQVGRVARVSGRSSSESCSRADLSARQRARAMRADSVLWVSLPIKNTDGRVLAKLKSAAIGHNRAR